MLATKSADAGSEIAHGNSDQQFNASDFVICPKCGCTMRRIAVIPCSSSRQPFRCDTS
jgi:hypothetical protein